MAKQMRIQLKVNGRNKEAEVDPRLLLVHLLRDEFGLTGTHIGCDTSQCGACTIMIDGKVVKACTVLAAQADGAEILTVEGLGQLGALHPIQEGFWEKHGLQCGYCTPGVMMTMAGLLEENPNPTEQEIREGLEGVICRCTGYQFVVDAVLEAAQIKKERERQAVIISGNENQRRESK